MITVPACGDSAAPVDSSMTAANAKTPPPHTASPTTAIAAITSWPTSPPTPSVSATPLSDPNDLAAAAEALADAQARWSVAEIDSYRLSVAEHGNYWSQGCTWTTVRTDGAVTDRDLTSSPENTECMAQDWSVGMLHLRIEQQLREIAQFSDPQFGQHLLAVAYNDVGVPTSIEFDLANSADEEMSTEVGFAALP